MPFWPFVVLGGVSQIVATFCTVALFSERSFAVGIAFTKSETLLVAAFSALVLGEAVSGAGLAAILVGTAGVIVLSRPTGGWGGVGHRGVALGLAAGALFGLSAIGYRGATLEFASDSALFRAVVALAAVTVFQSVAMALWLAWREPGEVSARGAGVARDGAGRIGGPAWLAWLVRGLLADERGLCPQPGAGGAALLARRIGPVLPRTDHRA